MINTLLVVGWAVYLTGSLILMTAFIHEGYTHEYRSWKPVQEEWEISATWPFVLWAYVIVRLR